MCEARAAHQLGNPLGTVAAGIDLKKHPHCYNTHGALDAIQRRASAFGEHDRAVLAKLAGKRSCDSAWPLHPVPLHRERNGARRTVGLDSLFDLHVHTREGSADSELAPEVLVEEVRRLRLKGVLLTEHHGWPHDKFEAFAREQEIVLIHAQEVSTDMGHVITIGLGSSRLGGGSIRQIRKAVDNAGGFMILAHPFRFFFGPRWMPPNLLFRDRKGMPATAAEAAAHPVFALVDAVEVVNGSYGDEAENQFAREVAAHEGLPGTGGSDAHSRHGIASGATLFHGDIRNERDLLDALRAGACTPLAGYNRGQTTFYG